MHKIDAKAVIGRLKKLLKAATDKDLSEKLRIPLGTILSWKGRNKIPVERIIDICWWYSLNPGFVLYGEGSEEIEEEQKLDSDSLGICITRAAWRLVKQYPELEGRIKDIREFMQAAIATSYSEEVTNIRMLEQSKQFDDHERLLRHILEDSHLPSDVWWKWVSREWYFEKFAKGDESAPKTS